MWRRREMKKREGKIGGLHTFDVIGDEMKGRSSE